MDATFGFSAPAWQILCAAAAICSVAATISTQMLKSNNLDERVARAESRESEARNSRSRPGDWAVDARAGGD